MKLHLISVNKLSVSLMDFYKKINKLNCTECKIQNHSIMLISTIQCIVLCDSTE